jgi:hypothetical protein
MKTWTRWEEMFSTLIKPLVHGTAPGLPLWEAKQPLPCSSMKWMRRREAPGIWAKDLFGWKHPAARCTTIKSRWYLIQAAGSLWGYVSFHFLLFLSPDKKCQLEWASQRKFNWIFLSFSRIHSSLLQQIQWYLSISNHGTYKLIEIHSTTWKATTMSWYLLSSHIVRSTSIDFCRKCPSLFPTSSHRS